MGMLGTIVRGLRSRMLLSVGSLLLVALAVGAAVVGPIFSEAVTRSYVISRVNDASVSLTGTSWLLSPSGDQSATPEQATAAALEAVEQEDGVGLTSSATSFETGRFPFQDAQAQATSVEDACTHLELTGRCPDGPGEALMGEADRAGLALDVGDSVRLDGLGRVEIVGTYRPPPAEETFWFDPLRLTSVPARAGRQGVPATPYLPAPFLLDPDVVEQTWPGPWWVRVDRRLEVPPDFTPAQLATLAGDPEEESQADVVLQVPGGQLRQVWQDDLSSLVVETRAEERAASASIAPAVISLVLVALALLARLLLAASELRVPELALASLRGMSLRQLWALGLSEPLALLAVATPLGVLMGVGMASALIRGWLVPGLPLTMPLASVLGTVVVAAAGVVVAVLAVSSVLRLSLSAQLGGVRRPGPPRRAALVAQLLLLAVAAAAVLSKVVAARDGRPDLVDLALPVLLAAVAGLAATRLVAWVTRWRTRNSSGRSLGGFVAARAVSRRQEGTLVIIPLTIAVAVGVFATGVYSAAAEWRDSVASTRAPADEVWTSPLPLRSTYALTHRLDPDGRSLMLASTLEGVRGRVVVVDAERLVRVTHWPDQWTPGRDAEAVAALIEPAAPRPLFTGTELGLTVDRDADVEGPLWVQLRLRSADEAAEALNAYLGPFPDGTSTRTASVPGCADGCWLEGVTVAGSTGLPTTMRGRVALRDLTVDGDPAQQLLTDSALVLAPDIRAQDRFAEVSVAGTDLVLEVDTLDGPGQARLVTSGIPRDRPVVLGVDADNVFVGTEAGPTLALGAAQVPVDPMLETGSVPLLGPQGVMIDYTVVTTELPVYDGVFTPVVLARGDAPEEVRQGLVDAGFTLATTKAEQTRILGNGAYALALRLYLIVAALVLAMATAGLVVSTAVQLPARRRDAASLRVVAVPRRQVMWAVALEFLVVLGAAVIAGLLAGTVAQDLVLRTVTLGYVDAIDTPALVTSVDLARVVLWTLGAAILVVAGAFLSAALTVRGARGATLRETAR